MYTKGFHHKLAWLLLALSFAGPWIQAHPEAGDSQKFISPGLVHENSSFGTKDGFRTFAHLPAVDKDDPVEIKAQVDAVVAAAGTINFCPSDSKPTSVYMPFGNDFTIGTGPDLVLTGCTVLVAFTNQGVHIAHYWEVPGFSAGPGHPLDFQGQVIDFMNHGLAAFGETDDRGVTRTLGPFLALLTEANLQDGAYIHMLATGTDNDELVAKYPARLNDIKSLIVGPQRNRRQGVPQGPVSNNAGVFDNAHVKETYYYADDDDPAGNTAYSLEYSEEDRTIRCMMTGPRPRILVEKNVDEAWDNNTDGPATAWSSN